MATARENDAPTPMLKKVAFTCYQVKDAKRARAFYEGTLGLKRGSHSSDGVWTEYDLPGGGCLGLFATSDAKTNSDSGAMIAFEVEDLDSLKARLKTEGIAFKAEMIPSPVCRMSIIVDSEGNAVMLHELRKK
jgi:predicted enzyme related to lactoylglutathione lyase